MNKLEKIEKELITLIKLYRTTIIDLNPLFAKSQTDREKIANNIKNDFMNGINHILMAMQQVSDSLHDNIKNVREDIRGIPVPKQDPASISQKNYSIGL